MRAQVGKNKVAHKLLSTPQAPALRKLKKTQLTQATNGWLNPWIHPAFRDKTQCMEGHSTFQPGPVGNTLQIGTFYTLKLPNSKYVSCGRSSSMSNSSGNWCKLAEQTVITVRITLVQHTQPSNIKSMKNDKKLWWGQSLATEYNVLVHVRYLLSTESLKSFIYF